MPMIATSNTAKSGPSPNTAYMAFLGGTVLVLFLLLALGRGPTLRLGGPEAIPAMWVGCAISLMGTIAGSLPIFFSKGRPVTERVPAALASMGLRLMVVFSLALAASLVGGYSAKPLLLWVAISHAGLLLVDSTYAVITIKAPRAPKAVEET